MGKGKILLVDDEKRMRKIIKDFLSLKEYSVLEADNGLEALEIFYDHPDIVLIILDVMMPKMDGIECCKEIRQNSQIPIIMLTAKDEEKDELLGFSIGVDEYIAKPFSPKILVARVEALLRRTKTMQEEKLVSGNIEINKEAHTVCIQNEYIELSVKEFELLVYFVQNRGIALSREMILNNVWDYSYFGDARTIDTHVKKLRGKLGVEGKCIKTIWGMGYKFLEEKT